MKNSTCIITCLVRMDSVEAGLVRDFKINDFSHANAILSLVNNRGTFVAWMDTVHKTISYRIKK